MGDVVPGPYTSFTMGLEYARTEVEGSLAPPSTNLHSKTDAGELQQHKGKGRRAIVPIDSAREGEEERMQVLQQLVRVAV